MSVFQEAVIIVVISYFLVAIKHKQSFTKKDTILTVIASVILFLLLAVV